MSAPAQPLPALHLLGQAQLRWPEGRVHVLERRDAALLAALVLQGPMPRERVAAWLWPDAPRKAALGSLRQRLFRLRQVAGAELAGTGAVLALAPGLVHDLSEAAGGTASGVAEPPELLGTLSYDEAALADWVQQAREQWRQRRRAALAAAAEAYHLQGRLAEALACAEQWLRDEPGAERAHALRMRLLYLQGDRAAALAAWAQCRLALREQADAEPAAETRALAALIEGSGQLPTPHTLAPQPPAALLRPPRLVGRAAAWQTLLQAQRDHQALLLVGEPGIGKTRLLADFARTLPGLPVLGARPGDARQPYALLQRLLRALPPGPASWPAWVTAECARLLPELGAPAPGRLEALRLQRALEQVLVGARAAGVELLVVDDVQFADAATLEALLACLSAPADGSAADALPRPWLAVRGAEMPPALQAWRATQPPGHLCECELAPLALPHIAELLDVLALPGRGAAEWAAPLARRTGGNPLFILQVLQSQVGPAAELERLPADAARLIEQRLAQLSPAALRLLRVAALAGTEHTLPLAAEVLEQHVVDLSDAVAELERAHLMHGARFAYDLVAEAAARSVPQAVAQLLHAGIARALQRKGTEPGCIGEHWQLAGEWAAAAAHFEQAAAQAESRARRADELRWLDLAAAAHAQAGDTQREFAARRRAANAAFVVELPAELESRVQALQAQARDDAQRLQVLLLRANQRLAGGDAAAAPTEQALALAQAAGCAQQRLAATGLHAVKLAIAGRPAEGLLLTEPLLPEAEGGADSAMLMDFFGHHAYVLALLGRYRDAQAPLLRAAEMGERLGELASAMTEYGNLSTMRGHLGDHAGALAAAGQALRLWRRLGEPTGLPAAALHMNMGLYCLGSGRFAEALAHFEWALAQFRGGHARVWQHITEHHLVRLWLALGQPARAQQCLQALPDDATPMLRLMRVEAEARVRASRGLPAAAALREALASPEAAAMRTEDRLAIELRLAATAPAEEALRVCEALLPGAAAHPPSLQAGLCLQADALRRLGRTAEAGRVAASALQGLGTAPSLALPVGQACWLLVQALACAGRQAEAQLALAHGLAWIAAALPHVPPPFVESFRERIPAHQQLLARHAQAQGPLARSS